MSITRKPQKHKRTVLLIEDKLKVYKKVKDGSSTITLLAKEYDVDFSSLSVAIVIFLDLLGFCFMNIYNNWT